MVLSKKRRIVVVLGCFSILWIYLFWVRERPLSEEQKGDVHWDMSACQDYVDILTQRGTQITLKQLEQGQDRPPIGIVDLHPLEEDDEEISENKVLYHFLWVEYQTNEDCPCRHCHHKLAVLIKSFLATQNMDKSIMLIWTNDLGYERLLASRELAHVRDYIKIIKYDPVVISRGTFMEGHDQVLQMEDTRAYLNSDLFRVLILYVYGGVYVDADSILLNDWSILVEKEFWTRWACTDAYASGILSFKKESPLARLILERILITKPVAGTYSWGRNLLTPLYNQLVADENPAVRDFVVYPACYFYPEWCIEGHHDYFSARSKKKSLFLESYAYHWHAGGGQRFAWPIAPGSQFDRTEVMVDKLLIVKYGWNLGKHLASMPLDFDRYQPLACQRVDMGETWVHMGWIMGLIMVFLVGMVGCFPDPRPSSFFTRDSLVQSVACTFRKWRQGCKSVVLKTIPHSGRCGRPWSHKAKWGIGAFFMCVLVGIVLMMGWFKNRDCGFIPGTEYSIGVYTGHSLFDLHPIQNPVLTKHDVTDRAHVRFVADPFLVVRTSKSEFRAENEVPVGSESEVLTGSESPPRSKSESPAGGGVHARKVYYMFFEVLSRIGEIGLATSANGINWKYEGIVLWESFHLSFPFVFQYLGNYYLVPESYQAEQVRVYKALFFPHIWTLYSVILAGKRFVDTAVVEFRGLWLMYVCDDQNTFLYVSITNPIYPDAWKEHPMSPIVFHDKRFARPAGRPVVLDDKLYRVTMDNSQTYGGAVHLHQVTLISLTEYREIWIHPNSGEYTKSPVPLLTGTLQGGDWNSHGMHQMDAQQIWAGKWLAAVDGCGSSCLAGTRGCHLPQRRLDHLWSESKQEKNRLVVVTAASHNHFHSLYFMLESLRLLDATVIVYDLGLTSEQVAGLPVWSGLMVRLFNYSHYPDYFDIKIKAGEYAWKPVMIQEVIMEAFPSLLGGGKQYELLLVWSDAGAYFHSLEKMVCALHHAPHGLLVRTSAGTVRDWTHPLTLEYLGEDPRNELFTTQKNVEAGLVGFVVQRPTLPSEKDVYRDIIQPWVNCALERECIGPVGSSRENHRQDQAVLSYLVNKKQYEFSGLAWQEYGVQTKCDRWFYHYLPNVILFHMPLSWYAHFCTR